MNITRDPSLLAAVAYADVFDYPLRPEELILWRVGQAGVPRALTERSYFFLPGRGNLVKIRRRKETWSPSKWLIARRAARLLRHVPGMLLVGVTGGLAMGNAQKKDDIDMLCLTAAGRLWTSRLLATLLLDVLNLRRRPQATNVADKICLNMFMEEGSFAVPKKERDLFAAHEVLQMVPLWDKGSTYGRFLQANAWVREFLPNAWMAKKPKFSSYPISHHSSHFIEQLAKRLQLAYMKKRRTSEVITNGVLRFHPKDARGWVRARFARRCGKFGIPLDKFFPRG